MYKVISVISTDFSGVRISGLSPYHPYRILKIHMFLPFLKRIPLVAMLGSALFLFGCSANMPLHFLPEFQGLSEEPEKQETDDPELQLVKTEPEDSLEQELEALSQTGQWGDKGTFLPGGDTQENSFHYDFPVVMNKQVAMYMDLFQNKQRNLFQGWLRRSGKYRSLMEGQLDKKGLPTDLIYLSMIESGYNQRAYSRAHAVGLWQFMRATGAQYELTIDEYVDERRNAEKSTLAAATFLSDLYKEFGDWHLAVAAYNAGPGKIKNGLKKYNVDNFWDLAKYDYLSLETKRYVPKLIAAIIIARQPEKFGFGELAYERPIVFDTVKVGPGMSLDAISIIAGTDTATIKELNQELRLGKTPANTSQYTVKIPAGSKQLAASNMERLHSYVSTSYKTHTVRKRETLAQICKKYDINSTTILNVNNLRSTRLKTGTKLRVPFSEVKYRLLPEGDESLLAAFKDDLVLHRIKKGETISTISKKYCVPTDMIVAWNGLKNAKTIRTGQQLALYIEGAAKKQNSTQRIVASTTKLVKAVDTAAAPDPEEKISVAPPTLKPRKKSVHAVSSQTAANNSWYQVKDGDSLWAISRKFNISADKLKEWNNLASDRLQPGNRLKMKKV